MKSRTQLASEGVDGGTSRGSTADGLRAQGSIVPSSRASSSVSVSAANPASKPGSRGEGGSRVSKKSGRSESSRKRLLKEEDRNHRANDDEESVNTVSSHEDDKTIESKTSTADRSRRSNKSAGAAMKFKDRSDKKVKPDFSYKYKGTQKKDNRTTLWLASFEGRIEEFIFPSLQRTDALPALSPGAPAASSSADRQRRGLEDGIQSLPNATVSSKINFPKWTRLVKEHPVAEDRSSDRKTSPTSHRNADFAKELAVGEKFLRDKILQKYAKGSSKREAETVGVTSIKSVSNELTRAIGLRGDTAALLDPGQEVVCKLPLLS
jgi:hypothetical protein